MKDESGNKAKDVFVIVAGRRAVIVGDGDKAVSVGEKTCSCSDGIGRRDVNAIFGKKEELSAFGPRKVEMTQNLSKDNGERMKEDRKR